MYWIEAKRQPGDYPPLSAQAGEWRAELRLDEVDAVWARVKALTRDGGLGYKSKVSTRPAAGQADADARLLCVRTYDARDAADVARVGDALRGLGLRGLVYVGG